MHPSRLFPRAGCLLLLAGCALGPFSARAADEEQNKADLLWNITRFIQWPSSAFAGTRGEFVFTILGQDSLTDQLATTLSTRKIAGRPVFVRVVGRPGDVAGSQMLYVASTAMDRLPEALHTLGNSPALTVADVPGFAAGGGMVDFITDDEHVRFEIHQGRAEKSGLKISAKLLALARVVEDGPAATR